MRNNKGAEDSRSPLIHKLFEAQVAQQPDHIAAVFDDHQLSYRELNTLANQLAHHLRLLGVGPEVLVGIRIDRSLEMLVGLLAILKAGGAYVPLDPSYPKERLAFMLEDARISILLSEHRLIGELSRSAQVICLDSDWGKISKQSNANPESNAGAESLAYVIYTSGSTGKPKGAQISHGAVINLLTSMRRRPGLTASDTVLSLASLSFDMSVLETFLPLVTGAKLVIASREVAMDGARLLEVMSRSAATFLQATPATWQLLLSAGWQGDRSLRVFCGGEAWPPDLANQLLERGPCLWNLYGPTETTVWSTIYKVKPEDKRVLIGRPIANTQVHILDEQLQALPPGMEGELRIGGDGLSRGYLNLPELTAEKFTPDPFSHTPGARLYKTGDLGRYLPDGNIECLGRIDHQVKIRGYRIELEEVEAILLQHTAIQQCVVVAREDQPGQKRLVAYLVADRQQKPTVNELHSFLKERLPHYMVPAAFAFLEGLPLSPNGKIDRLALPAPDSLRPILGEELVPPRTATEEMLAGVWAAILGLNRVGVHDNFFHLGGNSLTATRLVSRVRDAFQVELPLCDIFEAPTVAQLAEIIEGSRGHACMRLPSISVGSRDEHPPLSFPQERVWVIEQLFPGTLAYNFQSTLRLKGTLDVRALEQSLNEIARRHEIFRTTFPAVDGRPVQVIHDPEPIRLPVIDLSSHPESGREAEAKRRIDEELRKRFDLTQLPLVRWILILLGPQEHILVHVEHHLVHDGWSFNVFLGELLELYKAFSIGEPSPLPELPIQFADFAQWQRQWMQGEVADAQLAYWREKLSGGPLLGLPTDRPRPAVQSFRGTSQRIELPLSLCESVRELCRQHGVTLYMTLMGAFQVLLHRHTDQDDFCVGAGIANRRWPETEKLIGMLVNTVALRADLSDDPTFCELLGRVRAATLEAYDNQDLPFERLVEALQSDRDLSRNPLFQVMFNFHDAPLPELKLPGLTIDLLEVISNGSAKFDLNAIVIPRSEQQVGSGARNCAKGITMIWEYNTDLFDHSTIARMASNYQVLLEGIVNNPRQRVSDLPLMAEAERRKLLLDWNNTQRSFPDACISELFEHQVEQTPDAIALVFENESVTYRELNRKANQLAHHLRKLGAGPEDRVGICLERSIEMVLGLLGILKAGGAYLPLDTACPQERLALVLKDAGAKWLLTQTRLLDKLPQGQAKVICLDEGSDPLAQESAENVSGGVTADNLAYVMHTSGSTGIPKGVCITHRSVVRLVKGADYVGLGPEEVLLQCAPISFDASTFEIWGGLLNGARLVVLPPGTPSLQELGEVIRKRGVSTLWLTAGLFRQVVENHPETLRGVGQLLAGGDVLSVPHVEKALEVLGGNRLINGYGPTENTTFTCCHPVTASGGQSPSVPIGRPIANTQVYVLDSKQQLVPVGVPGELYAGGHGLARGYLNRPDLTAEKFVPNPFGSQPGARLYKTGDVVRYLPDGNIEFLGRRDQQLKIRGFRIEPGEVEAALARHTAVREAVVTACKDEADDEYLVAYVVAEAEAVVEHGALRDFLREKLPEYMVPSAFVMMDTLPLTANGKLDRQALPAPNRSQPDGGGIFIGPRTLSENLIAEIWSAVLNLERVGVHDNFFALGGHSLKATRVVSRVREVFRVELPVRALFDSPTVACLSEIIERSRKITATNDVPAIVPVPRRSNHVKIDSPNTLPNPKR